MSQEPSIDDILRLLKESVGTEDSAAPKKKRKGRSSDEGEGEDSYAIDPDFFKEVETDEEEEETKVSEIETDSSDEELAPWEEPEKEEPKEPPKFVEGNKS